MDEHLNAAMEFKIEEMSQLLLVSTLLAGLAMGGAFAMLATQERGGSVRSSSTCSWPRGSPLSSAPRWTP